MQLHLKHVQNVNHVLYFCLFVNWRLTNKHIVYFTSIFVRHSFKKFYKNQPKTLALGLVLDLDLDFFFQNIDYWLQKIRGAYKKNFLDWR